MDIRITRDVYLPHATLSRISVRYSSLSDWLDFGFCCEDIDRGLKDSLGEAANRALKIKGETAIPTGVYQMAWHKRPSGGIVPQLVGVQAFRSILIHSGNDHEDTEGCLLPGMSRDITAGTVAKSKIACDWLYDQLHRRGLGKVYVERA